MPKRVRALQLLDITHTFPSLICWLTAIDISFDVTMLSTANSLMIEMTAHTQTQPQPVLPWMLFYIGFITRPGQKVSMSPQGHLEIGHLPEWPSAL